MKLLVLAVVAALSCVAPAFAQQGDPLVDAAMDRAVLSNPGGVLETRHFDLTAKGELHSVQLDCDRDVGTAPARQQEIDGFFASLKINPQD